MKVKNIFKNNYLFIILFILLILKEPLYKLFINQKEVTYNVKCDLLENEYNKLLEFSNIDFQYNTDFINTYIIYKDIYDYQKEITIRGGNDYEFQNNPVIYNNTLVGYIDKVSSNSSVVKLITNNESKISVKINDNIGLLEYQNDKLIVSNIPNYSDIQVGDAIYTSGLGKIEENIYIGKVKDITLDNRHVEKIIEVEYNLKIKDINYVTVIKEKQ